MKGVNSSTYFKSKRDDEIIFSNNYKLMIKIKRPYIKKSDSTMSDYDRACKKLPKELVNAIAEKWDWYYKSKS